MTIKTVLITGAGSGIGLAFAKSLARIGSDLVLTSKDEEKLIRLKDELESKYGNKVWIIACDLTLSESIKQIIEFLNANRIYPDLFINNAGIGQYGKFDKTDESKEIQIIQLNILALTRLTKAMVKRMSENGGGTVINVASTIAFRKSPDWSVYAASKSYVWSFTRSLELEFRNSPIRIAVLCPGKTDTDFDKNAKAFTDGGVYSTNKGDSPEYVADYTMKKLQQNKKIIIPGFKNKLKYFLFKYFPDFISDVIVKSI
jgi:uncharacterized protein